MFSTDVLPLPNLKPVQVFPLKKACWLCWCVDTAPHLLTDFTVSEELIEETDLSQTLVSELVFKGGTLENKVQRSSLL